MDEVALTLFFVPVVLLLATLGLVFACDRAAGVVSWYLSRRSQGRRAMLKLGTLGEP